MDFTDQQVDDAIAFVTTAAEDRGSTVSYTKDPDSVTQFMKAFHDRCIERELPPMDALVVHVGPPREARPGGGYFKVNGLPDPYGRGGSRSRADEALMFWGAQVEGCKQWGIQRRRSRMRRP
ncbi:MAG TPA: hypothetical protein VEW93_11000 [Acidimicrobiales bacterium]|nr:hypothetical protein [Acidimicrobiales bacterium]